MTPAPVSGDAPTGTPSAVASGSRPFAVVFSRATIWGPVSSGYQERSIATVPLTCAVAQDVAMPTRQVPPRRSTLTALEVGAATSVCEFSSTWPRHIHPGAGGRVHGQHLGVPGGEEVARGVLSLGRRAVSAVLAEAVVASPPSGRLPLAVTTTMSCRSRLADHLPQGGAGLHGQGDVDDLDRGVDLRRWATHSRPSITLAGLAGLLALAARLLAVVDLDVEDRGAGRDADRSAARPRHRRSGRRPRYRGSRPGTRAGTPDGRRAPP